MPDSAARSSDADPTRPPTPARARDVDGLAGDRGELIAIVYSQLHRLADRQLGGERAGHTLQATALVHETLLRLEQEEGAWADRDRLVLAAIGTMRRVLVDHARSKARVKRGQGWQRVEPTTWSGIPSDGDELDAAADRLVALDEGLRELAEAFPRAARVVELRFFAGLDVARIASLLRVGERTVVREWSFARAHLRRALEATAEVGS